MKKVVRFSILGLILGLSIPAFIGTFSAHEAQGYSTSSLPTTIDLNDTSAANIRNYYKDLNGLNTNERQGSNLLIHLKDILKNGQKYYNYDSGSTVWQLYEIADRDWDKSPASSTTYGTYNSSTNKITNYQYGTSKSSSKNNPYIHALYIDREITNQTTAWDDHDQDEWGINREHVWPKAEGFETKGAGGARGDPMHLMAGNGYTNNIHSNYYYGYVNKTKSYTDCGSTYSNQKNNLRGVSLTLGGTTNVFEPQDSDKGDIARAIFYMVARYNYLSGSDSDGIDSNNPNLALTQSLSDWASSGYSSTTSKQGKMGIMTDLLNWHHSDPVSQYEIHRNNLLYTNYTNNRNPFIDFPEWADFIWGTATYNGRNYQSYSSTPTGYATPSSDTINGYNNSIGISISDTSISIEEGSTDTISATSSNSSTITWTTSNSSIVSISSSTAASGASITLTGVDEGTATITATATISGTNYSKICEVHVSAPKTLSSITVSNQNTAFTKGGTFEFGGTVTAHYSDNTTADVTASANFSGYDLSTTGIQTVAVSYGGKSTTYQITVTEASGETYTQLTSYNSIDSTAKYVLGVDGTGFHYSGTSGWGLTALPSAQTPLYYTLTKGSSNKFTAKTKIGNTTYYLQVPTSSNTFSMSTTEGTNTDLKIGTTQVSGTNYAVANATTTNRHLRINGSNGLRSYEGTTGLMAYFYKVNTAAPTLSKITLDTSNVQTEFDVGDTFTYSGLVVTAHYSDASTATVTPTSVSSPNMSTIGDKEVTVTYEGKTATYTISVSEPFIEVESVTLDKGSATLNVGESLQLTPTILPANATNKDVSWYTGDETIAEVTSSGLVTANKAGSTWIAVVTDDGSLEASCDITVQSQSGTVSDELTYLNTSETTSDPTKYNTWTYSSLTGSAIYTGNSMTNNSKNIQIRYNTTTYSGIVSTQSGGTLSSVTITWATDIGSGSNSGKSVTIYCKNTAYTAVGNLYSEGTRGTELGTSTYSTQNLTQRITITGNYTYIGILSSGAVYLSNIEISYASAGEVESISAVTSKVYHPGEAISASDVTVTGNTGVNISTFTLVNEGYQFKYSDAPSGGTVGTKEFTITATPGSEELSCTLTVNVVRNAFESVSDITQVFDYDAFDEADVSTNYKSPTTGYVTIGGTDMYLYKCYGYYSYGNKYISGSESKTATTGYFYNDVAYSTAIKNISVSTATGTTPNIRVSTDKTNWVLKEDANFTKTSYYYFKIDYDGLTHTTFSNLNNVTVVRYGEQTALNVSNFIMFEDTNGQCETKFDIAETYFGNMTTAERTTFMTSNDYVIKQARERLQDWAKHLGKQIINENSDYFIRAVRPVSHIISSVNSNETAIIVVISILSIGTIGGYLYLRKRRHE